MDTNETEKRKVPTSQVDEIALGDEVATLAVVSPLILQPLPITLHTTDLLAIVIRDGVGDRVGGWVDSETTDTIKEFLLFLWHG
jgi:hypothetical protein